MRRQCKKWCMLNKWPPVAKGWNIGRFHTDKAYNHSSELRLTSEAATNLASHHRRLDLLAAPTKPCRAKPRCPRLGATPRCRKGVAGDPAVVVFRMTPKHHALTKQKGKNPEMCQIWWHDDLHFNESDENFKTPRLGCSGNSYQAPLYLRQN